MINLHSSGSGTAAPSSLSIARCCTQQPRKPQARLAPVPVPQPTEDLDSTSPFLHSTSSTFPRSHFLCNSSSTPSHTRSSLLGIWICSSPTPSNSWSKSIEDSNFHPFAYLHNLQQCHQDELCNLTCFWLLICPAPDLLLTRPRLTPDIIIR